MPASCSNADTQKKAVQQCKIYLRAPVGPSNFSSVHHVYRGPNRTNGSRKRIGRWPITNSVLLEDVEVIARARAALHNAQCGIPSLTSLWVWVNIS